jgi:hypothetical protein
MTGIKIKDQVGVDFVLRSLGSYLKVPVEVRNQFGIDKTTASPKVEADKVKNKLVLTYEFTLDEDGKAKKQE